VASPVCPVQSLATAAAPGRTAGAQGRAGPDGVEDGRARRPAEAAPLSPAPEASAQVAELPEVAQEVLKFLGTSHQRLYADGRSSLGWQWYSGLDSMWLLWSQSSHLLDSCNRRGAQLDTCRDLHHKRE